MKFKGFGPGACGFFADLAATNTKANFLGLKTIFDEEIVGPMNALLWQMQDRFGGESKLFRQHRDVRFSKDKSPYKTATYGGVYNPAHAMGWYVAIDARGFFAGRGIYQMTPEDLNQYRLAVADQGGAKLAKAVARAEKAGVEISGEALKTAPRGFDRDHPRVDLLRRKNLIAGQRIPASEMTGTAPWKHAQAVWKRTQSIADWMDGALR